MDGLKKEIAAQSVAGMTVVLSAVAEYFDLSMRELREGTKNRAVVLPRQIAMYLAKQMTTASLQEIGQEFGGKHHTTVMHSIAKIHHLRATDDGMNKLIEMLLGRLRPTRQR